MKLREEKSHFVKTISHKLSIELSLSFATFVDLGRIYDLRKSYYGHNYLKLSCVTIGDTDRSSNIQRM